MIKVGIIGLGLIGSSILKGLYKNKKYELYCCSNSSYKKALKYCKNASNEIDVIINCDIVFVCTKASKTLETLNELNKILNKKTIVADVCSIKSKLLNKKYNFNFIMSHPMAGAEKTGFEAGYAELFKDSKWLIGKNNKILKEIILDLGAKSFKIDMQKHDELTAQISHLPTILSFLLFNSVDNNALKLASSGFRDMTRLSMSDADLALSMFNQNRKNILSAFKKLSNELNNLKKISDDEKINLFNDLKQKRTKMYDNNGKNTF